MLDQIQRVAQAINVGAEAGDIRQMLLDDGMSEYDAGLTYIAGKILAKSREEDK